MDESQAYQRWVRRLLSTPEGRELTRQQIKKDKASIKADEERLARSQGTRRDREILAFLRDRVELLTRELKVYCGEDAEGEQDG